MKLCYCSICGKLPAETKEKRLVIDHNHTTNIIRGWLCDPCNGKLGTFESKFTTGIIKKLRFKKAYRFWLETYYNRILNHLNQNTGFKYHPETLGDRKKFRHLYTSAFAG